MATELTPFAQTLGHVLLDQIGPYSYEAPSPTGGGSVLDGSDASYLQMSGWTDSGSTAHVETVSIDFALPAGTPTAFYLRLRARTDDALIADPPTLTAPGGEFRIVLSDLGMTHRYGTLIPATVFDPFIYQPVTAPAWIDGWWGEPDPANPTDPGNWFEFAADADEPGGDAALAGEGLRVTIGYFRPAGDVNTRQPMVDLYEVRMVVATTSPAHAPPLRAFPRDDGRAGSIHRAYPLPRSRQNGVRILGYL